MKHITCLALILGLFNAEAQTGVRSIGVMGDGNTDESAALQKAVDDGKTDLFFPKGRYRLTKTITVDLDKTGPCSFSGDGTATLIMEGAGPALHFIGTHGGTAAPDTVKANVWEKQRTPMVEGIEIIGAHAEADGIEATGTMQITLSRVVVRECRHAVHLSDRNRNVLIADCHFYHNRGIGVFYDQVNLHQSNIIGSHISYNGGGGVVSHGGNVRNLHIGTCDIEGNHAKDGPPSANVWLDSTGGSIGEVAITGCTIQHTSKSVGSANIRINGAGEDPSLERKQGRGTTREGNITIGDNVFSDVRVNIDIQNARGVTITGNTFWEGFDNDLLVIDSSHIVVTGNNFDRNPRYLVNGFDNAEKNGLTFQRCSDCVLSGNLVSGVTQKPCAVEVTEGHRFSITNNSILDSDGIGLLLSNLTASLVSDNLIRDDRAADKRSKAPSLKIVGGNDNLIGSNLKGNP
jgi:hypothetical protein